MPGTKRRPAVKPRATRPAKPSARRSRAAEVRSALASLKRQGSSRTREEMATRYGIHTDQAFGVPMAAMLRLARSLGPDHELAQALWATGWYEARMVASMIDAPDRVTPAQMERWCRDFDNWGICDTVCFKLFDRTPHAWRKVAQWRSRRDEFEKRAAFALLACLALHDHETPDRPFLQGLRFISSAATDERNFVRKAVNWALRAVGRRGPALHAAALEVARRLAGSPDATARWIGKDALRDLASPAVRRRMAARRPAGRGPR